MPSWLTYHLLPEAVLSRPPTARGSCSGFPKHGRVSQTKVVQRSHQTAATGRTSGLATAVKAQPAVTYQEMTGQEDARNAYFLWSKSIASLNLSDLQWSWDEAVKKGNCKCLKCKSQGPGVSLRTPWPCVIPIKNPFRQQKCSKMLQTPNSILVCCLSTVYAVYVFEPQKQHWQPSSHFNTIVPAACGFRPWLHFLEMHSELSTQWTALRTPWWLVMSASKIPSVR